MSKLAGATVFTKLDSNCGFWQIPLEENSRDLTTFITPFGRFQFNKLPFGINSAPEHFQCRMTEMLAGLEGVIVHINDVLVYGKTQEKHDNRLHAVLKRIESAGGRLNEDKCEFSKETLTFLGHVIGKQGVSSDPDKTRAIVEMEQPKTLKEDKVASNPSQKHWKLSEVPTRRFYSELHSYLKRDSYNEI